MQQLSQEELRAFLQDDKFFDEEPLEQFVMVAKAIVLALLVGPGDEELEKPEGAAATPLSPTESSGSPLSTEPEASSD